MTTRVRRTLAVGLLTLMPLGLAACGESKPSKEEVKEGMAKIFVDQKAPEDIAQKMASCVTDEVYDEVSTTTLKAMASGDEDAKYPAEDDEILDPAGKKCREKVASEL